MEDWRVTDGYYHYERDKSRYPAYPFRLSARDAARFRSAVHPRRGSGAIRRILSKQWVRRSSALYSIDDEIRGYGFMWWIYREPRFERHGMYAALGVGNQMIAALPESDLVIVNRADTYSGERTPDEALRDLVGQVLEARVGMPVAQPKLAALATQPEQGVTTIDHDRLKEYVGKWDYPPPVLGLPVETWARMSAGDGHVVAHSPASGTFKLYLQPDGSFQEEDSRHRYLAIRDDAGAFAGLSSADVVVRAALAAQADGESNRASKLMKLVDGESGFSVEVGRVLVAFLDGKSKRAEQTLKDLAERADPGRVEGAVNRAGYRFLTAGKHEVARDLLALNTRLFPDASNAWDSLGEAYMTLGNAAEAIKNYEKSLELNADNANAIEMIAKIREEQPVAQRQDPR